MGFNLFDPTTWFSSPSQILTVPSGSNPTGPIGTAPAPTLPPAEEKLAGNTVNGGPWNQCTDEYTVSFRITPLSQPILIPVEHIAILTLFSAFILIGLFGLVAPSSQTAIDTAELAG
jgi:hypothetical protein